MLKGLTSETYDTQHVFRQLLTAMATPGTVQQVDIDLECPGGLYKASGAILLSLLDFDTLFHSDFLPSGDEVQWLSFHTGMPTTRSRQQADFAVIHDNDALIDPSVFKTGSLEFPHKSTTLLVQTRGILNHGRLRLEGPGIETERYLTLKGVKTSFWENRLKMVKALYPMGVDMIFICENRFVAIPRTTKVEIF